MTHDNGKRRLHQRIRDARVKAGFSQERFAEAVGTSRRHVMRWENPAGGVAPGPLYRVRIADVTGEPAEQFEADEDEEAALDLLGVLNHALRQEISRALAEGGYIRDRRVGVDPGLVRLARRIGEQP